MEHLTLKVGGMSCMGCVNSVRNLLQALPGIGRIEIDLAGGRVDIDYDPGQIDPQRIRHAIEEGGYQVI